MANSPICRMIPPVFLMIALAAAAGAAGLLASEPLPAPEGTVPEPVKASLAELPRLHYWPVKLKDKKLELDFTIDLDLLAPLGDGKANAALWFRDFVKADGSRSEEAYADRIDWERGKETWRILPAHHPLLLEAEPWVDQAVCRFYPDVWKMEGAETDAPNLLFTMILAKSWVARGMGQSDPNRAGEDFRRAIRLGRLFRQDDVTIIQDLIALAALRLGIEAMYELAQKEGDAVTMIAASHALTDITAIRLETASRIRPLNYVIEEQLKGGGLLASLFGPSVRLNNRQFGELLTMARTGSERRFRLEAMLHLWFLKHLGTGDQRKKAEALIEKGLEDPDSLVADSARWYKEAKWDTEKYGSFHSLFGP